MKSEFLEISKNMNQETNIQNMLKIDKKESFRKSQTMD